MMTSQQSMKTRETQQLTLSFNLEDEERTTVTHKDGYFVMIEQWPDGYAFVNTQYQDVTFATLGDALSFATHLLLTGELEI